MKKTLNMKIGLTYDLRSHYLAEGYSELDVAEFDSEQTIESLENTIRQLGYETERIGTAKELCSRLVAGCRWDLVFNIAEGLGGCFRESQVPTLLEIYGINYTFSDPLVCAVTLDKSLAKRIIAAAGLATPKFKVVRELADLDGIDLYYPLFAKPLGEGTGKGIDGNSRISSPKQLSEVCGNLLDNFVQPVLVEEFLPGREFTAAVLGTGEDASVLGTMEIIMPFDSHAIYSYHAKEECEKLVKYAPCPSGELKENIERLALASHRALQCRDVSRVD
ncbi:MAG: D-alanine--D-alanine ligase, partial [Phycisphaerae bacterium]|nr:D-alanine--D-alanine ligase [Phycisphaerae bacterium]